MPPFGSSSNNFKPVKKPFAETCKNFKEKKKKVAILMDKPFAKGKCIMCKHISKTADERNQVIAMWQCNFTEEKKP